MTEGNQNDFSKVTEWFVSMVRQYNIRPLWIGYDPWNSQYWVKKWKMQDSRWKNPPRNLYAFRTDETVRRRFKNKLINYNNNPILKWCFANTQAKVDLNGNIQPSKLNSKLKRIDGCVALIIAYAVLTRYKTDYENMVS